MKLTRPLLVYALFCILLCISAQKTNAQHKKSSFLFDPFTNIELDVSCIQNEVGHDEWMGFYGTLYNNAPFKRHGVFSICAVQRPWSLKQSYRETVYVLPYEAITMYTEFINPFEYKEDYDQLWFAYTSYKPIFLTTSVLSASRCTVDIVR